MLNKPYTLFKIVDENGMPCTTPFWEARDVIKHARDLFKGTGKRQSIYKAQIRGGLVKGWQLIMTLTGAT